MVTVARWQRITKHINSFIHSSTKNALDDHWPVNEHKIVPHLIVWLGFSFAMDFVSIDRKKNEIIFDSILIFGLSQYVHTRYPQSGVICVKPVVSQFILIFQ